MNKKPHIESIYNLPKYLKDDSLLPIYFLFGEDSFTISNAVKAIEKKIVPLVESDFDFETLTISKESSVSQFVDLAYSFPFGAGKKLIVVKGLEAIKEKKNFSVYVNDPAEFTVMIISHFSQKVNLKQEPFKSLFAKGYIFEARELVGQELFDWMMKKAKIEKINLTKEAGELLIEMVGDNKGILEMQLNKISTYAKPEEEITPKIIQKLAEITKEYSIFDLQGALDKGDKAKAISYAYNILSSQGDMIFIIAMLTRYVTTLARVLELKKSPESEGKKEFGPRYYYLKKPTFLLNEQRLHNSAKALLEADIRLKSTNIDDKTNLSILIAEILK
ncbi:MAG: DNA polymerase III subunit delta [Melioribacteraceae bacterium]|nr:DNA polymerase III subunit delta [Melioribacteraceae bacterium]